MMLNNFAGFLMWFIPLGIVPIDELYAWSNNEKIHILFHKINEIVKATHEYDKAFMEVKDLLEKLDDDIKTEVLAVLNAWKDDDTIKNMLDEISADYFDRFQEEIDTINGDLTTLTNYVNDLQLWNKYKHFIVDGERMFRVVKDTAHYMFEQPAMSIADDDTRVPKYSFCQGSTHFFVNGTGYFACIFISNDGSKFSEGGSDYYGNGLIEVYNHNGDIIYSKTVSSGEVGHGNAIAYHNGYLYFQGDNTHNGDTLAGAKLRRIKWDLTGTIESTILRMSTQEPFYGNCLSSHDNKLYIASARNYETDVAIVEMENDNVTPTGNVINLVSMTPPYIGYSQNGQPRTNTVYSAGFAVTDEYFYFGLYNPSGIMKCVRQKNSNGEDVRFIPTWYYEIPAMLNYGLVKTGEIEGISVDDNDNIYIITTQHLNTKAIAQGDITQFFIFNPNVNTRLPVVNENQHTGRKNIYCTDPTVHTLYYKYNTITNEWDSTNNPVRQNATVEAGFEIRPRTVVHSNNPFGTDLLTDGFPRIDEACWYFNNLLNVGYGHFQFEGGFGHIAFCVSGKTYYFDGKNNTTSGLVDSTLQSSGNDGSITVMGNLIAFGGLCHAEQCAFYSTIHYLANSVPSATRQQNLNAYNHQKENPIFTNDNVITFLNSSAMYSNNPNVKGGLYIRNSTGNYNLSATGSLATWGQDNWIASTNPNTGYHRYYMNAGTSMINVHGELHEEINPEDPEKKVLSSNNAINLHT